MDAKKEETYTWQREEAAVISGTGNEKTRLGIFDTHRVNRAKEGQGKGTHDISSGLKKCG